MADILDEIANTKANEIVLTGINMSDYRMDGELALKTLVQEIDRLGKRFRISSIECMVLDDEMIEILKKCKNFCPHFHLSLQSACNETLKRMNRHYTPEEFKKSVKLIRKYFPLAGITTDVIVGFCGETDEEFDETYNFVKSINFSELHIFSYSPREGTVAYKMFEDLPSEVKKQRSKKMQELANGLKQNFIEKNKKLEVLFEEQENEYYVGYSKNYIKCYVKSEKELINDIKNVEIVETYKDGAICKII